MNPKPTYDDANLILRLYDMRREDRMRQARAWFTAKCKVTSYDELMKLAPGAARRTPHSAWWSATGTSSRRS